MKETYRVWGRRVLDRVWIVHHIQKYRECGAGDIMTVPAMTTSLCRLSIHIPICIHRSDTKARHRSLSHCHNYSNTHSNMNNMDNLSIRSLKLALRKQMRKRLSSLPPQVTTADCTFLPIHSTSSHLPSSTQLIFSYLLYALFILQPFFRLLKQVA